MTESKFLIKLVMEMVYNIQSELCFYAYPLWTQCF
jgi:hypothetical protein